MGLFDSFFGKSQRRDIQAASRDAEARLAQGRSAALGELNAGQTGATGAINTNYDRGRAEVAGGYDAARGAIGTGYNQARTDLTGQYGSAESAVNDAMGRVRSVYEPLAGSGNWAQQMYDLALGRQGQAGAASALEGAFDPYRQYRDEMANKQLQAQFNARGLGGSGRFASALSRASLERGSQDLQQYLTRLENQATRGQAVAGQLAGYEANAGQQLAGIRTGLGDRLGSLETNRGTALGQLETNRGSALGQMDTNRGNVLADIANNYAQNRAGVESGFGQQMASNRINLGNANAATRSTGVNNLINLVGTAISAATGMPRMPMGGTTTPGTATNGGWSTTTQRANPLASLFNWG